MQHFKSARSTDPSCRYSVCHCTEIACTILFHLFRAHMQASKAIINNVCWFCYYIHHNINVFQPFVIEAHTTDALKPYLCIGFCLFFQKFIFQKESFKMHMFLPKINVEYLQLTYTLIWKVLGEILRLDPVVPLPDGQVNIRQASELLSVNSWRDSILGIVNL